MSFPSRKPFKSKRPFRRETTNTSIANSLAGLWARYGFENDPPSVAFDSSGHGRNGILVRSPVPVLPRGLLFNESLNQSISLPTLAINISTSDTRCLWIKTLSAQASCVFCCSSPNSLSGLEIRLINGVPEVALYSPAFPASTVHMVNSSATSLADGMWHHLALVRNFTHLTLFVDGVSQATADVDARLMQSIGSLVNMTHIARREGNSPLYFSGIIDDIRVYTRAISERDLLQSRK